MTTDMKVFPVNKTLEVEGFDPNEYARPYDENPDESYLPYDIQRWWFEQVYPKGRIEVSKPEQDPEHTPGAYVATAKVWKDKDEEKEDICISNRAVPSDMNTIDPYQDCQRKAISLALKTLGFWLTPSRVVVKPMVDPDVKGLVKEPASEETTSKKRGRKAKEETSAEPATTPVEETNPTEKTEEVVEESPVNEEIQTTQEPEVPTEEVKEEAAMETPATEPVSEPVSTEEVEEAPVEDLMDLETARNTVINYRTFSGRTMGELADSENQKDHELLVWFATSSRAATRYPDEVAAAKVIIANQK